MLAERLPPGRTVSDWGSPVTSAPDSPPCWPLGCDPTCKSPTPASCFPAPQRPTALLGQLCPLGPPLCPQSWSPSGETVSPHPGSLRSPPPLESPPSHLHPIPGQAWKPHADEAQLATKRRPPASPNTPLWSDSAEAVWARGARLSVGLASGRGRAQGPLLLPLLLCPCTPGPLSSWPGGLPRLRGPL